jgi:hypothetical protein
MKTGCLLFNRKVRIWVRLVTLWDLEVNLIQFLIFLTLIVSKLAKKRNLANKLYFFELLKYATRNHDPTPKQGRLV